MANPDYELEALEKEFPRSMEVLAINTSSRFDQRVLSVVRRHALHLAAAHRNNSITDDPFDFSRPSSEPGRTAPTEDPGSIADMMSSYPAGLASKDSDLGESDMPPRILGRKRVIRSKRREAPEAPGTALEMERLYGMDRETWRQRIAELILRGDIAIADFLIQRYRRLFDE